MEMGQKYGLHHTYWGFPQVQTEQTEARSRGIPWDVIEEKPLQYETTERAGV